MKKLNVRLLRRIQKHISEEPRRFFMGHFHASGIPGARAWTDGTFWVRPSDLSSTVPACGTAACIAGWANGLTGGRDWTSVQRAANKLGLAKRDGHLRGYGYLFLANSWPELFKNKYFKARTPKTRARIACERIDYLIEMGE